MQKTVYQPAHNDKVMTRKSDDLRVGVIQRPGDTKSKVQWRSGQQTVCNASLMPYTPELLQSRLEGVQAAKQANKSALMAFPDRAQAEQFAALEPLRSFKTEVRDCSQVNRTGTPFHVHVYGINQSDLPAILGTCESAA